MTRPFTFGMAAALLALAGCQAPLALHQLKQPIFVVGQLDAKNADSVATAGQSSHTGELTVDFRRELSALRKRVVLAKVADVDHVAITVTIAGATFNKSIDHAALAGGQASVTFTGLPVGVASVMVAAYDVAGQSLGSTTKQATVVAGVTTPVDIPLQLNPTVLPTGGGSSATTGGLSATVSLLDGAVMNAPLPASAATYDVGIQVLSMAIDKAGNAWIGGEVPGTATAQKAVPDGRVVVLSPTGQVLRTFNFNTGIQAVAADSAGNVWVAESSSLTSSAVWKLDSSGSASPIPSSGSTGDQIVVSPNDTVFRASNFGLSVISVSGPSPFSIFNFSTTYFTIDALPDNRLLVAHNSFDVYSSASAKVSSFTIPNFVPATVKVDGNGNYWAIDRQQGLAKKISASGATLATIEGLHVPPSNYVMNRQRIAIAGDGDVWIANDSEVYRVSSQGNVKTTWLTPPNCRGVVTGSSRVWLFGISTAVTTFTP